MGRPVLMSIVLVLLVVLLLLMIVGWRNRKRRQSGLAQPERVPHELGAVLGTFDGMYVATTVAGDPLNRIAVGGLGFRSRATVTVADAGLVLALAGENDVFIPRQALREATRATWTIDRVVETGGLVLIGWSLESRDGAANADSATNLDSYFRLDASAELLETLTQIIPASTGRKA